MGGVVSDSEGFLAIEETYRLPHDSPYRQPAVELLAALKTTLENNRNRSKTDQELLMRLLTSPLYLEHVKKSAHKVRLKAKLPLLDRLPTTYSLKK